MTRLAVAIVPNKLTGRQLSKKDETIVLIGDNLAQLLSRGTRGNALRSTAHTHCLAHKRSRQAFKRGKIRTNAGAESLPH